MTYSRPVKLFRGFDDYFYVPHSRYTEVHREDIEKCSGLRILSESESAAFMPYRIFTEGRFYNRTFRIRQGHA